MNINNELPLPLTLQDLECYDEMYYVGDILDVDGDGWVNQETAELVLLEYNACVK